MMNRAMQRKLEAGECLDLSRCERTATGDYLLEQFTDDIDYCDAATESWIWSVGRLLKPLPSKMADGSSRILPIGAVLASTSSRFYTAGESEVIECLFLR